MSITIEKQYAQLKRITITLEQDDIADILKTHIVHLFELDPAPYIDFHWYDGDEGELFVELTQEFRHPTGGSVEPPLL